ncbi:s1 rna binding domain-containing protein [Cystoisospora suis]|uniref:S1 rna binding domain-containing protein n=1 Tax=Cystoisospora suis TaxID=483139 RepID=A0A2C6L7A1_9APIC|nr:s1 rna binding domain-containing protein [Cystoisospora suis]
MFSEDHDDAYQFQWGGYRDRESSPSAERPPQRSADTHRGVVKRIQSYGAFVRIDALNKEGLLHISRICDQRVEQVEDVLAVGQEVWVKVLSQDDGKLRLCMKSVNQHDGTDRESLRDTFARRGEGGGLKIPELDSVHQGTVRRIQDFGAFISIDGFDRDGLLHISCISSQKLDKVDDVLTVGDKVWVKVTKVEDGGKFGLDMRGISQKDGTDNDPNNLSRQRGPRPKAPNQQERLAPDAVYNVTCHRCGGKGHMTHECYNTGGNKYEILEDEQPGCLKETAPALSAFASGANAIQVDPVKREKLGLEWKKAKKEGEEHKKKKRKKHKAPSSSSETSTSDDSDDSDSSSEPKKKKSKKRKSKEKKSKHHKKKAKHH